MLTLILLAGTVQGTRKAREVDAASEDLEGSARVRQGMTSPLSMPFAFH